jgi:hypothetical protein
MNAMHKAERAISTDHRDIPVKRSKQASQTIPLKLDDEIFASHG